MVFVVWRDMLGFKGKIIIVQGWYDIWKALEGTNIDWKAFPKAKVEVWRDKTGSGKLWKVKALVWKYINANWEALECECRWSGILWRAKVTSGGTHGSGKLWKPQMWPYKVWTLCSYLKAKVKSWKALDGSGRVWKAAKVQVWKYCGSGNVWKVNQGSEKQRWDLVSFRI